ncbi:MAG: phosphoenolpyruvate carboxylase, partial [Sediminibacterium sp.]|nr:phosphoenolpyruvate carboxylase [Sediminibacterium sp.]
GNPNVTSQTTIQVAKELQNTILGCYYREIRLLKKYLTFAKVEPTLTELESLLYQKIFNQKQDISISQNQILDYLLQIFEIVKNNYFSLHIDKLEMLIFKVKIFGTHFACIDIRQDSRIHTAALLQLNQHLIQLGSHNPLPGNYLGLSEKEKLICLAKLNPTPLNDFSNFESELNESLEVMANILEIQKMIGEQGCQRYIISNCKTLSQILELYYLLCFAGHDLNLSTLDIIPLFESINDLIEAEHIVDALFSNPMYKKHLNYRNEEQTIMLGFSDGTKDGGYMQANYSIYQAKMNISKVARKYHLKIIFFDGRGGPPSRGGGNTHKFYSAQDRSIMANQIQITIQGQTITSNFGNKEAAKYNIEQLVTAGLKNLITQPADQSLSLQEKKLMHEMGVYSYEHYKKLKKHPLFLPYLQNVGPLTYYGNTNIGSRPTKRNKDQKLSLDILRAIPFVGSWSQIKQNVPGFYGMGYALQTLKKQGHWEKIQSFYHKNLYFNTLINNSMMSMLKSNFELTAYLEKDKDYGKIWKLLKHEFELTKKLYLELTGLNSLLGNEVVMQQSIKIREKVVLPLLIIQQYGLFNLRNNSPEHPLNKKLQNLITRTMFGIINAARNSA